MEARAGSTMKGRTCCSGVDPLSHKKKANFWRDLAESFPQLIDFLCNPADVGQVFPHSLHL
jgi:hypothetical protein